MYAPIICGNGDASSCKVYGNDDLCHTPARRNIAVWKLDYNHHLVYRCCVLTSCTLLSRLVTVSLAFLVIPFLPASNILFSVGFVVAERVLYLPSAGYCLLVALGIRALADQWEKIHSVSSRNTTIARRESHGKLLFATSIGDAGACVGTTPLVHGKINTGTLALEVHIVCTVFVCVPLELYMQRSQEWLTEETLFVSGAAVCPLNAKVCKAKHAAVGSYMYATR